MNEGRSGVAMAFIFSPRREDPESMPALEIGPRSLLAGEPSGALCPEVQPSLPTASLERFSSATSALRSEFARGRRWQTAKRVVMFACAVIVPVLLDRAATSVPTTYAQAGRYEPERGVLSDIGPTTSAADETPSSEPVSSVATFSVGSTAPADSAPIEPPQQRASVAEAVAHGSVHRREVAWPSAKPELCDPPFAIGEDGARYLKPQCQ